MKDETIIQNFSGSLSQSLVLPSDSGYDEARSIWNGMIDKKPAMIAICGNADDVVKCINFAREHDLPISVKGGGHNVSGKAVCDEGLMIDLSRMNNVEVDSEAETVKVEAGATLGDLDRETQKFDRAVPVGVVSKTGVAGLTLGGGIGYLARKYGLTIDNLISVAMVTADGKVLTASENDNLDLFWAVRGGGGNFGVVTSFKYKLHKVGPEIMSAQVFYKIEDAGEVLRFYRDLTEQASDELAAYCMAVKVPPVEPFPAKFHGKPAMVILACHNGNIENGIAELAPLQKFGDPILRVIAPIPFVEMQKSLDEGVPSGMRYYWKAHNLENLPDEAIDEFADQVADMPGEFSIIGFEPLGGAISRVDENATAFPERNAFYSLGLWSGWMDPADDKKIIKWTREFYDKMIPYSTGGVYSNYLDRDDAEKVSSAFGSNYERLQEVKGKYDSNNFFSSNQNVKPNF